MFKSARSRLRAAVFACAAALGLGAYAATPVAVWDGESPAFSFSKLTRNGYTLGNIGGSYMNTAAADGSYLQIGNNNAKEGITFKKADGTALPASTIIVKCENITATDNYNRALIAYLSSTAYQGSHAFIGIARSKNGTLTINDETVDTVGAGCFIYQGKVWDNTTYVDGAFAPPETGGKTIALSYGNSAGTAYYVDGVKIDSNSNLKSSGFGPQGIVLGGVDTTGNGMFYPMVGMKITAIAFFSGIMTDDEVAAFKFPSDGTPLAISDLNGLTAEGGAGTGDVDKSFTSIVTADVLPTEATAAFLKDSSWLGVVDIDGLTLGTTPLSEFGNANSTIFLSGDGVTVDSLADNVTFAGILAGDGALNVTATPDSQMSLNLTGDATAFAGDITIATGGKARVVFGSQNIAGNNNCLVVGTDATVTVASGKTWTAPAGFVIKGNATVNGTLSGTVYGDTGVITVTKNQACTVAASWTGTVKVAYNPGNVRIKLADYGSNANAKIEIVGDANGAFGAFPATDWSAGDVPSITAPVNLTANWTVSDGWAAQNKVTTFAKLSGSGTLTVTGGNGGAGDPIYYTITTLENFTGTLAGARGKFTIGTIVASSEPTSGAKLVNCTTTNAPVLDDTKVTYNGAEQDVALEFKAGDGIYVAVPTVTITVPTVDNTTVTVTADGVAVSPTEEGGIRYEVADGAAIVVTYAAAAGYVIDGPATYEFTASEGSALKPTGTSAVQYAALVSDGTTHSRVSDALTYVYMLMPTNLTVTVTDATWEDNGTYDDYFVWDSNVRTYTPKEMAVRIGVHCYPTLASAVAEATDGQTVTLLADVTLDSTVVVTNSLTLNLNGFDIAATDARALWIKAGTVSITGEGEISANATENSSFPDSSSVIRVGDSAVNANAASLTIGADVTVSSGHCYGITAFGKNTPGISLVVNGTVAVTGTASAISGNGSSGLASANITVNSGAVVSATTDAGIYFPGTGTLAITGGTITGPTAVYAKCGTVNITGGTLTGTAEKSAYAYNGNGLNATGDALVIDTCGYPGNPATVSVTGGTFTSQNADAVASYKKGDDAKYADDTVNEAATGFVSGGTFNTAVADTYCANGYEPKDNGNGTYGVRVDKGWIYEDADFPNYTGAWSRDGVALDLVYDSETHKAAIEDGATYTASKPSDGRMVTLNMTIAFDDACSDDEAYEGAKAAVRLGEGETEGSYVFQLYTTNETGTAAWLDAAASGVTPTIDQDYAFTFVLDMTNRTYTVTVGGVALTVDGAATLGFASANASDTVQSIEFAGAGKVSSIIGSYEDIPVPEGFAEDDTFGVVTLTAAQAAWLNGQANYDALAAQIAAMDATAFNDAYLLNLDILDTHSGYTFAVKGIVVGEDKVDVTVTLTRTGALTENEKAKPIVGTLKLKGTATLGTAFTVLGEAAVEFGENAKFGDGATETTVTVDTTETDAKFYQPVIE